MLSPVTVPLKSSEITANGSTSLPTKAMSSPVRVTSTGSSLKNDFSLPSTRSPSAGPRRVVQPSVHFSPFGPAGRLPGSPILILRPSTRPSLPRVITCSPASIPLRTTNDSPAALPSLIRFWMAMPSLATKTTWPPETGITASFGTVTTGVGEVVGTFSVTGAFSACSERGMSPDTAKRTVWVPVRMFWTGRKTRGAILTGRPAKFTASSSLLLATKRRYCSGISASIS